MAKCDKVEFENLPTEILAGIFRKYFETVRVKASCKCVDRNGRKLPRPFKVLFLNKLISRVAQEALFKYATFTPAYDSAYSWSDCVPLHKFRFIEGGGRWVGQLNWYFEKKRAAVRNLKCITITHGSDETLEKHCAAHGIEYKLSTSGHGMAL